MEKVRQKVEDVRIFIEKMLLNNEKVQQRMAYLYERWKDEQEFEDWADYEENMKKFFNSQGFGFEKAIRKPFGTILLINDFEYKVKFYLKAKGNQFFLCYDFIK